MNKRFFVKAGYGYPIGKGNWSSTQVYEYAGFPGVETLQDALENMRKNFYVQDAAGNEVKYELEGWEDVSCPGCAAESCLRRTNQELKNQLPLFEDELLIIYPRCKQAGAKFTIRVKGAMYDKVVKVFSDPGMYYKLYEIKTLGEAVEVVYKLENGLNGDAASLMRLAVLREEAKLLRKKLLPMSYEDIEKWRE